VVLSIPAIIIAAIVIGIPLNWLLGGTRTAIQRISIAVVSVPATIVLAIVLFTFNAFVPETYAALLRFADAIWQASLNALSSWGDDVPGATKLTNIARQGFSGHHYVIMALCSIVASFLVNAAFALATKSRDTLTPAQKSVAYALTRSRRSCAHPRICQDPAIPTTHPTSRPLRKEREQ
jgi:hypothetical protein